MNDLTQQKSAVKWLRILYPLWAIIGMYSIMYIPSQLIEYSNPELTSSNILTNETMFRVGIAGSLVTQLFSIAVVWFLYKLFYPTFKDAIILMTVFAFLGMPIAMGSNVFQLAALEVIEDPEQVVFLLKLYGRGTMIATIFWGLWLLPMGYMIIRSPLFPRLIGWLVVLAGIGYTISAFAYFMDVEGIVIDVLDYTTFGEVIWMLWVLVMGARWKALN
jgi:hypothetical protein